LRKSRIRSAEKPQTEQADQDQIDRDDDVQKAGMMRIRTPAMSATIGCKCAMLTVMIYSPFWLAMRLKTARKPDGSTL
jgi:hypothetical protein